VAYETSEIDRGDGVDDGGVAAEIERRGLDRRRLLRALGVAGASGLAAGRSAATRPGLELRNC
jgi:hypothetical protein